jgi:hypothetical protein
MQHDEACVRHAIRLMQNHCLSGGMSLRFAQNVPPTPTFARHIDHYYTRFCQDAIASFLLVGFAPYWLRRCENGVRIPEVLPLGMFGWHVARNTKLQPHASGWFARVPTPTTRESQKEEEEQKKKTKQEEVEEAHGDLLRYEVTSVHCGEPVRVYAFDRPSPLFMCGSRLATVLPSYHCLLRKREYSMRADKFNSKPGLVFKQHEKSRSNEATQGHDVILASRDEVDNRLDRDNDVLASQANRTHQQLESERRRSKLPDKSVALVAPAHHDVVCLDRVLSPQDMIREELAFARTVAFALGLPAGMLLQGSSAIASSGGSSASSGDSSSWADGAESNNRQLLDTCRNINQHLELLLCDVYTALYNGPTPCFRITTVPTLSIDQLLVGFNAHLIGDSAFSGMLEKTCGAPLGPHAIAAREELRRAEYVLPFRDRVVPPGSGGSKKTKR